MFASGRKCDSTDKLSGLNKLIQLSPNAEKRKILYSTSLFVILGLVKVKQHFQRQLVIGKLTQKIIFCSQLRVSSWMVVAKTKLKIGEILSTLKNRKEISEMGLWFPTNYASISGLGLRKLSSTQTKKCIQYRFCCWEIANMRYQRYVRDSVWCIKWHLIQEFCLFPFANAV